MKNKVLLAVGCFALFAISCKKDLEPQPSQSPQTEKSQETAVRETPQPIKGDAIMTFDKELHDFGDINEGEKAETIFKFTNTGTEDLLITKAKGSCGCTAPEYPKNPIKPGESGEITVRFNSNGRPGKNNKSVSMEVNTKQGYETINIKANVLPK